MGRKGKEKKKGGNGARIMIVRLSLIIRKGGKKGS